MAIKEIEHMDYAQEGGLDSYLEAIRANWLLVLAIAVATVVGTATAVSLRSPTYTATAKILIAPLPIDDETFLGLPLVRDTGDATRTVQTAASLIETPEAAALAARRLGPDWSAQRVEDATTVQGDGQSNLLAVDAKAGEAVLAARVASEYARSALVVRQQELRTDVAALLARQQRRQRALAPGDPGATRLAEDINRLDSLRGGEDPTLRLASPATPPDAPSDPPAWLLIFVAIVGGVGLGCTVALVRETLAQNRLR